MHIENRRPGHKASARSGALRFAAALLVLGACGAPAAPKRAAIAPPPRPPSSTEPPRAHAPRVPTPRRPLVRDYSGTKVTDDYAWLEDGKDAEVQAWSDAQTKIARAHLDGLPERPRVHAEVEKLLGRASPDYLAVRASAGLLFALKRQPPKQQPIVVTRRAGGDTEGERVLVDPGQLDPSGKTTVDFFVPSPDGKVVAVSLSKDGTESGDVHVFDVSSGKESPEIVTRVNGGTAGGSLAWNVDASGFYYTRYPHPGERPEPDLDFFQEVYFHKLGTTEDKDTFAFGKDLPKIAEIALTRSDDGRSVLAVVANGDGGDYEHHVLRPSDKAWVRLTRFEDKVSAATFGPDGKVYAVARKGAQRGRVIVFSEPWDRPPELVLAEGEGVIEDLVVTKSALYVSELVGGPSRVRRVPLGVKAEPLAREPRTDRPKKGDKPKAQPPVTIAPGARGVAAAELPLPPISSVSSVVRLGEDLLLRVESFTEPPAWHRYVAAEHRLHKTTMAKAPLADMSDVEVVRETCVSKDGTKVPMSVLRKKGAKLAGDLPVLLTGYGGYGLARKPRLRPYYRVWLDHGGAVADANLRGGSELGEAWHEAGKLTRKQNVFDDFRACARALVDLGYTRPERLAITGRSNGGLLMGAALVQDPSMARAVVSAVGIYDMLTVESTPNGAFNVTEFGSVKDEAQLRAMLAYSPLHNVRDGVAYPAVLFTTGANDPRVDPYHSRKMVARLQRATSSERPILLVASEGAGHGMGTPLGAEIEETADMLAFLLHELGVP